MSLSCHHLSSKKYDKPRLIVSGCLLGQEVRYNGGHAKDARISMSLSDYVEWFPVCPELGAGMGIPRETVKLIASPNGPRMVGTKSGDDHTEAMQAHIDGLGGVLKAWRPDGFILKKKSPSCGLERIPVHGAKDMSKRQGMGMFAAAMRSLFPLLPMEEEGRLNDARLRESFITRIYAHLRWRRLRAAEPQPKDLVAFHTAHKLILMGYDVLVMRKLGSLVSRAGKEALTPLLDAYEQNFFSCLAKPTGHKLQANVLYHLMGYLKHRLSPGDKQELIYSIENFRKETSPLSVPLTLFKHHFRNHPHEWVNRQHYLNPYPADFRMRDTFSLDRIAL